MSDLQIGLLAVGALVVVGVLLYNGLQERRARRAAERAFGSQHADVLMAEPGQRREPSFEPGPRRELPPEAAPLPDERLDYVIELAPRQPVSAAEVGSLWAQFEHRFAGRALLAVSADRQGWRPLGQAGSCAAIRAALQLASRAGPVSEAELIEFRAAADTLAAGLGAAVQAPETRRALETARELDQLCADADIQVVLHVVPQAGGSFEMRATEQGAQEPFAVAQRADGAYSLSLDVPRTADVRRGYDAMVLRARDLGAALGGVIVDDNGRALDERALAGIGAQLEAVHAALAERGIEPGSPAALRLFS
jgi:hypothetical protein